MLRSKPLPRISGLLVALMMSPLAGAYGPPEGQMAPPETVPPFYGQPYGYTPPYGYGPPFGHGPGVGYGPGYAPPFGYGPSPGHWRPYGPGPAPGYRPPAGYGPPPGYGAPWGDAPPFDSGSPFDQIPPFGRPLPGDPAGLDSTWPSGYAAEPGEGLDPSFGPGPIPGGPPGMTPGRFGPPAPMRARTADLNFNQLVTDDAYVLEIHVDGQWPEAIQIEPRGQGLLIRRASSTRTTDQRTFDDGRGYAHRYSYASGTMARRLPVPPDGDLTALTREDGPDLIRVSIPRRNR
ncbi:hypothetical protein ABC977_07535 [Thioalkalicoccus limnaeus]|uniref:SHSP domain-containing protein n=1 Tax=Thioalkalicoccus limnaeus TaxID=120681 RepID=A0ABV4BCM5_9GAMM